KSNICNNRQKGETNMKIMLRVSLMLTSIVLLTACGTFNSTEKSETLSEMEPFRLADYIDIPRLNETYYDSLPDQDIDVKAAYVLHVNTKDTLYKENSDESLAVASMSKLCRNILFCKQLTMETLLGTTK